MNTNSAERLIDRVTQVVIPVLTIGAQILVSLKLPEWGIVVNLMAQPFWIYSTYRAYKKAGQVGLLINSVVFTLVLIGGLVNYWLI